MADGPLHALAGCCKGWRRSRSRPATTMGSAAGAAIRAADTRGFLRRTPRVGPRRGCQPGFRVPGQAGRERVAMRLLMQLERDTDGRLCGEITCEGAVTWLGFSGTL